MLTVTESAKRQLKETLLAHSDDPEFGLRLLVKAPGEFGLRLDKEAPGDHVVEHEGSKALLVGQELSSVVDKVTLDTQDTPDGTKLVISRK